MPKKPETNAMKNFFGLQPAAATDPNPTMPKVQAPEQEFSEPDFESSVETFKETDNWQSDLDTYQTNSNSQQTPPRKIKQSTGRPASNVERVPITLSVKSDTDAAIAELTNIMQSWRGRRRGVAKVGRNDVVDFAVEYLLSRITNGESAAESFYRQRESAERNNT